MIEIPNLLRGYLYPSRQVSRCPRFHRCQVSNKCQSYDRHSHICQLCESRVAKHTGNLGGYLPDGAVLPDVQHAMKIVEDRTGIPFAHPDNKRNIFNPIDVRFKWEKTAKAAKVMSMISKLNRYQWSEEDVQFLSTEGLLGRFK